MAVGQGALLGGLSYLAVGREQTYGTMVTTTAALEFLSGGLTTMKESKILEQVANSRTYTKRVNLSKKVEGSVEFYFYPEEDSSIYFLQSAFGSTITSATATGETAGAGANSAITHTFEIGSMGDKYKSLSVNMRKGDSTTGKVFEYSGVRVNELTIAAEIDDCVKFSCGLIAKDSTLTTNDIATALTVSSVEPLTFINGRFSVEATAASLTSSSYWHVQSMEFKIGNSLKADTESRRIGSDVLSVLPPGMASLELKCSVRFDTSTAFDAMINATDLSAEFEFLGNSTYTGSNFPPGLKLEFPEVFIAEAGDPQIGGPDEILTSEITFHVLRDPSSASGYACKAYVTNQESAYA